MAKVTCLTVLVVALCLVAASEARRRIRPMSPLAAAKFDSTAALDSRVPAFTTHWYTQTLDHFSFANTQTFQQRYLIVNQYYKPGHPILFYTGNEGDIMMFYNNTGLMFELAQKWSALVIFAEHRYYGQTLPFGQNSFTPANMAWLTAEQALADYAQLLRWFKQENPQYATAPIISFGGSYGGMLTAWFRMSYPNIVAGGLAASAPLVQFVGLYDNYDLFNEIVTNDYAKFSQSCSDSIRAGFNLLNTATSSIYSQITSAFKLCSPIKHNYDVQNLIAYVENAITYMAMTDYPDATNFLQPLPAWPVDAACRAIARAPLNVLAQLAAASNVYYNTSGSLTCNDLNAPSSPGLGDQSWNYQACSELVLPSSATGVKDFFPPAPFIESQYTAQCQQSLSVTPRYTWIPLQYGGFNITAHSNIIFSNGNLDPWSGGGIKETLKPSLPAIIIDKGAHHLDLRFSSPADPPSVITARKQETSYLLSWIREWYDMQGIPSPL